MGKAERPATIAGRQQGVVTRAQLVESGLSLRTVNRRLADGDLVLLHPGVYAMPGSPDTFARKITAAVLGAGPGAVASHRAAAYLQEMADLDHRVEVSVLSARRPRLRRVTVHRVRALPAEHVTIHRGLAVTTPARTVFDLAATLGSGGVELILDRGLACRRFTIDALHGVLAALSANTPGAGVIRELLAARTDGHARVESPFEQRAQELLERSGIGGWFPQRRGDGHRLDLAFPEARLVVELDSYRHHSSRSDWERDHTRNADLVAAGWRILPVTWGDLRNEDALLQRIRWALGARAPQWCTI